MKLQAREREPCVLELRFSEGPLTPERGGSVCLVSLADYFNFISDDEGRMRAEIFQDNVRDYEGANTVNRAITETLRAGDAVATDFWWLNNGVTIIGRRVQTSNKKLVIDDPQIVNGLQTSRNIYQHFSAPQDSPSGGESTVAANSRCLLVRVVQAEDDAIAAEIIKATNSQTRIPPSALRATEPFQKDIEEFFSSRGLYYERRKNEYRNQGRQRRQIVAISELAQAVAAILLYQPHTARGQPSALVRGGLYEKVFNQKTPLATLETCVRVIRRVDEFLAGSARTPNRVERSSVRFHLARAACAFALQSSRPRAKALAEFDLGRLTDEFLDSSLVWVLDARDKVASLATGVEPTVLAKGPEWSREMDRRLSRYTSKSRWPLWARVGPGASA